VSLAGKQVGKKDSTYCTLESGKLRLSWRLDIIRNRGYGVSPQSFPISFARSRDPAYKRDICVIKGQSNLLDQLFPNVFPAFGQIAAFGPAKSFGCCAFIIPF
jgi:hypothetical protein